MKTYKKLQPVLLMLVVVVVVALMVMSTASYAMPILDSNDDDKCTSDMATRTLSCCETIEAIDPKGICVHVQSHADSGDVTLRFTAGDSELLSKTVSRDELKDPTCVDLKLAKLCAQLNKWKFSPERDCLLGSMTATVELPGGKVMTIVRNKEFGHNEDDCRDLPDE